MSICGMLSDSIFRRYALVETSATVQAMQKLEAYRKQQETEFGRGLFEVGGQTAEVAVDPQQPALLQTDVSHGVSLVLLTCGRVAQTDRASDF